MEEGKKIDSNCRSFFQNGEQTRKRDYTQAWIHLINQIEKRNSGVTEAKKRQIRSEEQ